jgi:mono/diheme cytochrome c family protein
MSSFPKFALGLLSVAMLGGAVAQPAAAPYPGVGRAATASELKAWDIDVRPDFKGLPPGSGTVAQGMDLWESQCASCHGVFGESNSVFSPLVGGTTAADITSGRVARLNDPAFPGRTTLMKVSNLSTLWDYIHRAMPWNAPKSLSPDQVYAVTAYLLNLGGVLPDNFTLSNANMAEVQQRLPNRNGKTTAHGLWPDRSLGNGGRPDVKAVACMKDCEAEPKVASFLPDHARNAHGNLAQQQRLVGAQHGADTTQPPGAPGAVVIAAAAPAAAKPDAATDVSKKHGARADATAYLTQKIQAGGSGVWGAIPMPPQTLPAADAQAIAKWLAEGAQRP